MDYRVHQSFNTLFVSFWTVWIGVVLAADCCDLLVYYDFLASDWPFASNNLKFVFKMVERYHLSDLIAISLFAIIILWCVGSFWLFLRSLLYLKNRDKFLRLSCQAYLSLIALHLVFDIADEIFIFYDFTDGLMGRISLLILCYAGSLAEGFFLVRAREEKKDVEGA